MRRSKTSKKPQMIANRTDLLECATPESVPLALRNIAQAFAESSTELQSAWDDDSAGAVWKDFARILDRAAQTCDKTITKRLGARAIKLRTPTLRCYACGKHLSTSPELVDTRQDQLVYVGRECARWVRQAGAEGYQPPGGPRLFSLGI